MLKTLVVVIAWAISSAAPAQTPAVTPSQVPAITPSQTPSVNPPSAPVVGGPAPVTGGLSRCANMIGLERDNCLRDERARVGNTGGSAVGAGSTQAPGGTGTGQGAMGTQPSGPAR